MTLNTRNKIQNFGFFCKYLTICFTLLQKIMSSVVLYPLRCGSIGRIFLEAGVKLSSHTFKGLRRLSSRHSWFLSRTGKVSFRQDFPRPHPTFISLCRSPQLPCLLPAGGWWDVRRSSVGGHVVRLQLPAGQLGGHHGHQPSGPDWFCTPAASCGEISETLWSFWVKMHAAKKNLHHRRTYSWLL